MREYLKNVLELTKPYRFRFALGLLCGFLSGALAFTLPLSLKLAVDTVFPEEKTEESAEFVPGDITNLTAFAASLAGKTNEVCAFLFARLDPTAQEALANPDPTKPGQAVLRTSLALTLNRTISGPSLFDEARFRSVTLRPETRRRLSGTNLDSAERDLPAGQPPTQPETRRLIELNQQAQASVQLNRMLLEDAFPKELAFKSFRKADQKLAVLPGPLKRLGTHLGAWFGPSNNPSAGRKALAIVLIPGAMFVRGLLAYLNIYLLSWVGIRASNDLRVRVFSHMLRLPIGFFNKSATGDLMAVVEAASSVNATINTSFGTIIREPITILVLVLTLFGLDPLLSGLTLVVFPVCLVPVIFYGRKLRKSHTGIYSNFANVSKIMQEAFTAMRVIKAYNLEGRMAEQFRRATAAVTGFYMRSVRASEVPGPLIEFIGSVGVSLIFVYFAFWAPSGAPVTNMLAFFFAVFSLYAPVKNLSRLHSQLTLAEAGVKHAYRYLGMKSNIPEPAHPKPLKARGAPIRFENVTFGYEEKTILHKLNLTIQSGQFVALVGRTGSGKTSITNLLLRFYDPQAGAILIGDTDIRSVSSHELRSNIAIVTQTTILFNDTLLQNILVGRDGATQAEVEEAARHAFAHDFIIGRPEGYQAPAGEKGVNFSGGQQQRIAIARAIVRDAPILILDEATNALDPESERFVQTALEELMRGRTTICIAHRLSTIQNADLIVVLDNGRVVETGTHPQLIKAGGLYSKLYEIYRDDPGA